MKNANKSNKRTNEKTPTFRQLLWRAGFVTAITGQLCIDYAAACEYLHCSERTLYRWLDGSPCPRAVALIEQKARLLPPEWSQFSFSRTGALITPQHPHGLTPFDVMQIGTLNARATKSEADKDYLRTQLDAARDDKTRIAHKAKMAQAVNLLQELLHAPEMQAPGERPLLQRS